MGDFGIKVAKAGKRTPETADPRSNLRDTSQRDLIFNSDLLTFKYVKRGILAVNDMSKTYQIAHNLNYYPSFQLWSRKRDTGVIKQVTYDAGRYGPRVVPWVDKTNLYLLIDGGEDHGDIFDVSIDPFDLIYFIGADDLENTDS